MIEFNRITSFKRTIPKKHFIGKFKLLFVFCIFSQNAFTQKITSYHLLAGVHYGIGLKNDVIGVDATVQSPYYLNFGIVFEKTALSSGNYDNLGLSIGTLLSNTKTFSTIFSVRGFYSLGYTWGGGATLYGRYKVADFFYLYGGPMINYFGENLEAVVFAGAGFKFGKF